MQNILVIPSIDIKDGKTVRVVQGIPELNCEEYGNDPIEMAKIWRAENAKLLHIVDFDGAWDHSSKNIQIIKYICKEVIIPIEYSGGIRSLDEAKFLFDCGISRITLATLSIENPKELEKIVNEFGSSKIALSLDVIDNEIVIRGRKIKTGISFIAHALQIKQMGIERFIITDVKRNGILGGPNLQMTEALAQAVNSKVTHSGGIRNKDELMDLQKLVPLGVDSVIIGRALYENRFPCQKLWRVAEAGIFA